MTDVVIGLPIVCIVAFVIGAGWAAIFCRITPHDATGFIFISWTIAIVSTSLVWAWTYPLNQGISFGLIFLTIVSLSGYILAFLTRSFRHLTPGRPSQALVSLAIAAAIAGISITPGIAGPHRLSVGQRIGPDAVGYAISAQALGSGLTRLQIEHGLEVQLSGGTIQSALTPKTEQVDRIPSFTTQVQNEFLTGANRWGLAGAVGMVVYLAGSSHLWSSLSLLTAFALMTACIGIWAAVKEVSKSTWAATSAAILLGLSPSVLNAWHEGSMAEIWIMPATLLLAIPVIHLGVWPWRSAAICAALGTIGILPAYSAALVICGALLLISAFLSAGMLRKSWWNAWSPIAAGGMVGALLIYPATATFAVTLARSLQENGIAGWQQAHWVSLSESFGFPNMYGKSTAGLVSRSPGNLVVGGIGNALTGALILGILYRLRRRRSTVLLTSVILVALAVYLQTRYVHPSTNYQFFKTVVTLAPAGFLGFGVALGEALLLRPVESQRSLHRARRPFPAGMWIASSITTIAVVSSGFSFVFEYRDQAKIVPTAFQQLANSDTAQSAFIRYNVLAPQILTTLALGAEVDLNWIGRYEGNPPTRLANRIDHPVALLVLESSCPLFRCLSGVRRHAVILSEGGVALVQLSDSTNPLARLSEQDWPTWADARLRAIGGPDLNNFIPYPD